jgi:hypothetical protein
MRAVASHIVCNDIISSTATNIYSIKNI